MDPVYLHQTRVRLPTGAVRAFADLPELLAAWEELPSAGELRTHFHIPLSVAGWGDFTSTRALLTPAFFAWLATGVCPHVELETYTFAVLPEPLRREGVVASLAAEYQWFLSQFRMVPE